VRWPEAGGWSAEALPINERVREILGFDYGAHLLLREAGQPRGTAWHYGFDARSGSKSLSAYVHQPTVCLTAGGAQLVTTHGRQAVDLGPFTLEFEHYTFRLPARGGGQLAQVYWCVWDELAGVTGTGGDVRAANLRALWTRTRSLERQVLLVSLPELDPALTRPWLTDVVRTAVTPVVHGAELRFQ
jgi:hypothetical protein